MALALSAVARHTASVSVPPAAALLAWYDRHRRSLPWRAEPGEAVDPYRVWLSEIMLQQTTVAVVIPYFERFLARFPTVFALAAAPVGDVMAAWAGLGYYARARNLHACAGAVAGVGRFPEDVAGLRALPGIGDYTATAIAAIAFGRPGVPVDGNVERVCSRVFAVAAPMPAAKPALRAAAVRLGSDPAAAARPSDYAQALFDLGATICIPAAPACAICPWVSCCAGRAAGIAADLPARAAKREKAVRHGVVFHLTDGTGRTLLRTRPPTGLFGGMAELPGTPWRPEQWQQREATDGYAPAAGLVWRSVGSVRHGLSHFELRLDVLQSAAPGTDLDASFWVSDEELGAAALPSVMRKCLALARRH